MPRISILSLGIDSTKAAQGAAVFEKAIKRVGKAAKAATTGVKRYETAQGKTGQSSERLAAREARLQGIQKRGEGILRSKQAQLTRTAHGLATVRTRMNRLADSVRKGTASLKRSTKGLKDHQKQQEQTGKGASVLGTRIKQLAAGFLSLEAARRSLKVLTDFENGALGVAKTADLAGQDLVDFEDKILTLSTRLPVSTNRLLELAQAAGQLGVKGSNDLLKFAEVTAKLGNASDLTGEQGAKMLARMLNVTKENISTVDVLASVIVRLGNNAAASEREIAKHATQVAQTTTIYKLTSTEASALGATYAELGLRAELASTATGRVFNTMAKASREGGEVMEALTRIMGVTRSELAKLIKEAPVEAFSGFLKGLKALDDAGGSAAAAMAEVGLVSVETQKAILPAATAVNLMVKNLANARDEQVKNLALNREAAVRAKSLSAQWVLFTNVLKAAMLSQRGVSNELKVVTNLLTEMLGVLFEVEGMTTDVSTTATVLARVLKEMAIFAVILALVKLATMMKAVAVATGLTTLSFQRLKAAMIAHPILTWAVVISGVIVALRELIPLLRGAGDAASENFPKVEGFGEKLGLGGDLENIEGRRLAAQRRGDMEGEVRAREELVERLKTAQGVLQTMLLQNEEDARVSVLQVAQQLTKGKDLSDTLRQFTLMQIAGLERRYQDPLRMAKGQPTPSLLRSRPPIAMQRKYGGPDGTPLIETRMARDPRFARGVERAGLMPMRSRGTMALPVDPGHRGGVELPFGLEELVFGEKSELDKARDEIRDAVRKSESAGSPLAQLVLNLVDGVVPLVDVIENVDAQAAEAGKALRKARADLEKIRDEREVLTLEERNKPSVEFLKESQATRDATDALSDKRDVLEQVRAITKDATLADTDAAMKAERVAAVEAKRLALTLAANKAEGRDSKAIERDRVAREALLKVFEEEFAMMQLLTLEVQRAGVARAAAAGKAAALADLEKATDAETKAMAAQRTVIEDLNKQLAAGTLSRKDYRGALSDGLILAKLEADLTALGSKNIAERVAKRRAELKALRELNDETERLTGKEKVSETEALSERFAKDLALLKKSLASGIDVRQLRGAAQAMEQFNKAAKLEGLLEGPELEEKREAFRRLVQDVLDLREKLGDKGGTSIDDLLGRAGEIGTRAFKDLATAIGDSTAAVDILKSALESLAIQTLQEEVIGPLLKMVGTVISAQFTDSGNPEIGSGNAPEDPYTGSARGNVFVPRPGSNYGALQPFEKGGVLRPFAKGGVLHRFQRGEVVSRPASFPMAGGDTGTIAETEPEAIMPLDRDPSTGRLGVKAIGGGGKATAGTQINVVVDVGGVAVDESQRGGDASAVEALPRIVGEIVRDQLQRNPTMRRAAASAARRTL